MKKYNNTQNKKNASLSSLQGKKVTLPVVEGRTMRGSKPRVQQTSSKGIRVRHREYLGQLVAGVQGASLDQLNYLPMKYLNPGIAATFPWLSMLARNYENYTFHELNFEYISSCATTNSGNIYMAVDYDAKDSPPQNKAAFMDNEDSVRLPVWDNHTLRSTKSNLHKAKEKYCRYGDVQIDEDLRVSDLGTFSAAISNTNIGVGAPAGEIYIIYDVELITPQNNQNQALIADSLTTTSLDSAIPNPYDPNAQVYGNLAIPARDASNSLKGYLTFPNAGQYLINIAAKAGSTATVGTSALSYTYTVPAGDGDLIAGSVTPGVVDSSAIVRGSSWLICRILQPGAIVAITTVITGYVTSTIRSTLAVSRHAVPTTYLPVSVLEAEFSKRYTLEEMGKELLELRKAIEEKGCAGRQSPAGLTDGGLVQVCNLTDYGPPMQNDYLYRRH
jgi:hypothetical protein